MVDVLGKIWNALGMFWMAVSIAFMMWIMHVAVLVGCFESIRNDYDLLSNLSYVSACVGFAIGLIVFFKSSDSRLLERFGAIKALLIMVVMVTALCVVPPLVIGGIAKLLL